MELKFIEKYGPTVGRVLLGAIFVFYGFDKLFGIMGSGYSGLVGALSAKGFPVPNLFAVVTILVEAGGGLMLVLGFKARLGALALFLFIIPVTLVFHPAWADPSQTSNFLKNLALMGGMLYVMVHGSGPYSLKH